MLDNQAKDDLRRLYESTEDEDRKKYFWSVLECVGCEEEFKDYLFELKD